MSNYDPPAHDSGSSVLGTLVTLGIGALLMYFFDPDSGRRRRELVREKYVHGRVKLHDATEAAVHAAALRTSGAIRKAQQRISPQGQVEEGAPLDREIDTRPTPGGL